MQTQVRKPAAAAFAAVLLAAAALTASHAHAARQDERRGEPRTLRVDETARPAPSAANAKTPRSDAAPAAPSAPAAGAVFRLVPSESWIPAIRTSEAPHKARTGGFFGGFTE
jgi:hypothetical protein